MEYFANKIAIVTGGASGLGKTISQYLARHGARVIIADRDLPGALQTESLIIMDGGSSKAVRTDVSDPVEVKSVIENTLAHYGRIDFLFNNAGIGLNGEFQDTGLQHWKRIMDVNFWGTVYGCHYVYPVMMKQGSGHIINVSSLGGLIPGGLMTGYSASKHAVVGLSLSLRSEAKQYGIKVTALCPGYIETPIHKTALNVSAFLNTEKNRKLNAGRRYPTADDCIDHMMRGVRRNKSIIVSPSNHQLFWWVYRMFPRAIPLMWMRIIKKMKINA